MNDARLNAMESLLEELRLAVRQLIQERDSARQERDEFIHFITSHRQFFEAQRNGNSDGQ